jgi:transposase-like protein
VLTGLPGDVAGKELCRSHEVAETLYYWWREKLREGRREVLAGKQEREGGRAGTLIGQLRRDFGDDDSLAH